MVPFDRLERKRLPALLLSCDERLIVNDDYLEQQLNSLLTVIAHIRP